MKRKPNNLKYTDMAIYIDNSIYTDSYEPERVYQYLQWLFFALSYKKKFFTNMQDYDNYSLYGATTVYLRLTNKKQFLDDNDPRKIKKIKSVLNYIKHILQPLKVNYQKQTYNELFKDKYLDEDDNNIESLKSIVVQNQINSDFVSIEIEDYFQSLPKIIKEFVRENTNYNSKIMVKHLYISLLITLLRNLTLSNHNKAKLLNKDRNGFVYDESILEDMQEEETLTAPTIYRLDLNMKDYIRVINNKVKQVIIKDIRHILKYHELSDDIIQDILLDVGEEDNIDE